MGNSGVCACVRITPSVLYLVELLHERLRAREEPRGQPHELPAPLLAQPVPVVRQLLHHLAVDLVAQDLVLQRTLEDLSGMGGGGFWSGLLGRSLQLHAGGATRHISRNRQLTWSVSSFPVLVLLLGRSPMYLSTAWKMRQASSLSSSLLDSFLSSGCRRGSRLWRQRSSRRPFRALKNKKKKVGESG